MINFIGKLAISLLVGIISCIGSFKLLIHVCELKLLSWDFCGDLTGFIHIVITSHIVALLVFILVLYILLKKL